MSIRTIAIAGLVTAGLAAPAVSAEVPNSSFSYGEWSGAAYTDDSTGKFFYCNISRKYENNEILEFAVYYTGSFSFYLTNPAVPRRQGDTFNVTMMTPNGYPITARFDALNNNFLEAIFSDTLNVVAWLTDATSFRVLGIEDDRAYELGQINGALVHLLGCAAERIPKFYDEPQPSASSPAPTGSSGRLPPPRKP